MKNKTPALGAEVLCKALDGILHENLTLPTHRMQWLAAVHALSAEAAAIVAGHVEGGRHD